MCCSMTQDRSRWEVHLKGSGDDIGRLARLGGCEFGKVVVIFQKVVEDEIVKIVIVRVELKHFPEQV